MIIVTGATGAIGGRAVIALLDRVDASEVAVSVRDPSRLTHLRERGVRVRHGDYADPASLRESFEGASQVLLISAATVGDEALRQHGNAIDAARAVGAERVVYTSHQAAGTDSAFGPAVDHARTEALLAGSGLAWTALRDGFHANTVPFLVGGAAHTGELRAPADGPVSWTHRDDLGDAAAAILAEPGRFDGPTPPLTGPQALDLADVATLLGTDVRRVVLDDDEWVDELAATGLPRERAQMMLGLFRASRAGEFDVTDPALGTLIGRPPTPLATTLAQAAA